MKVQSKTSFNIVPYYITQYIWILFLAIPIICSFIFPKKTNSITIFSSKTKYNKSIDPIIFGHVSDTHINSLRANSIKLFRKTFDAIKNISPEFVVITGDIVDNYDSITIPRYGEQNEKNWKIYQEETSNLNDIPIIEVCGNHDMFGIKSVLGSNNYFINYSHSFNRNNTHNIDDFRIHSFQIEKSKINIIAINPFDFPTAHPPLLLYKRFSKNILNHLEREILQNQNQNIIICHYPIGSIHSEKSKSGLKFTDIIGSQKSVDVFLSGHSHPNEQKVYHHGKGGIEIIGVSNTQKSQFGIVSIDNGGVTWSMFDINNPPKGVITYPIHKNQLSPNAIFNDIERSEIRVVVFSKKQDLSINFNISESKNEKILYSGTLNYSKKLSNNNSLYTFPLNKCIRKFGSYKITFSGDFDGHTEFVVCDKIKTKREKLTEFPRIVDMLHITFPILVLILLFISFINPFHCNCCNDFHLTFNDVEEWIEESNSDIERNSRNWTFSTLFSIMLIRVRFQRIPIIIRIFVFLSVIYCFLGPILFFKTEDLLGFVCMFGYFINNQLIQSDYGVFYSYFYLSIVCTPMILICSCIGVKKFSKYQIFDIIFFICGIIGDVIVLIRIVHQTTGPKYIFTSIGFIYIPFAFILLITFFLITFSIKKKQIINESAMDINETNFSNQ